MDQACFGVLSFVRLWLSGSLGPFISRPWTGWVRRSSRVPGQALRAEHLGPCVERQVCSDANRAVLVALATQNVLLALTAWRFEGRVECRPALEPRDRHHEAAPDRADPTLEFAWVVAPTPSAMANLEPIMGWKGAERLGQWPGAVRQVHDTIMRPWSDPGGDHLGFADIRLRTARGMR